MSGMLVIGIGNRLMCDDGIGPQLADALCGVLQGVEVIAAETDVEYALAAIRPGDFVVLLDAVLTGDRPGSVHVYALQDVQIAQDAYSLHDVNLIAALKGGDAHGSLIGIEAAVVEPGFGLSPQLADAFSYIQQRVTHILLRMREEITAQEQ